MEMVLNNNDFEELNQTEMMEADGGIGFLAGLAIGFVCTVVIDGVVIATTGKSCGEWTAEGIHEGVEWIKSKF